MQKQRQTLVLASESVALSSSPYNTNQYYAIKWQAKLKVICFKYKTSLHAVLADREIERGGGN